jgi:hypothetical protein
MKHGSVPASWLPLSDAHRIDAKFWLDVLERVNRAAISHTDLARVAAVVEDTERDYRNYREAMRLRDSKLREKRK